jgi:dihydrodipicolinate synthase/N-acetylneuraminate lyase
MSEEAKNKLLPGMAAIAVWMFLLSLGGLVGVTMHRLPLAMLILCAAFAAAGQGLLARRRWGWAMTLAAVFLSATFAMWTTVKLHQPAQLWFALVNMVFFLYLVRPEVRARLR